MRTAIGLAIAGLVVADLGILLVSGRVPGSTGPSTQEQLIAVGAGLLVVAALRALAVASRPSRAGRSAVGAIAFALVIGGVAGGSCSPPS